MVTPMMATASTTAPTTSQLRIRSLRCCSRISAWARSDFDCRVVLFAIGEPFVGREQQVVEGEAGARPDDQPRAQRQQPDVTGDVERVLALRVGRHASVAEASAVDLQAAGPGRGDADDEGEEEQ